MKPELFIRSDGSYQIGVGHLVRCTALALMIKDNFSITFFCREIPENQITELEKNGLICIKIENEEEFQSKISSNCIVVLDGYHFDTAYQKQIRATGAGLVCIDDLHDQEFVADLIINHAPGIAPKDYKTRPYTQFALGPDYALLRPAFLEQAKKERKIKKVETVMICLGGSDYKNLTQGVLQVVLKYPHFKKIIVVTGPNYRLTDHFAQLLNADIRIDHRHALNEQKMLGTLLESDLAIVPASGILFEVLAAGCVVISGSYIDNQKFVHENFRNSGLIVDAGNFQDNMLNDAIENISAGCMNPEKVIDGHSATRILKLFNLLQKESFINLRSITAEDLDLTFRWASDPDIRRFSFQQHPITKPEHTKWFEKKLSDTGCRYSIVEYHGAPVGSIRFDIREGVAMISYLLGPAYHGQGLGQLILKKGIEWLMMVNKPESAPVRIIAGDVMKTNFPSVKAFERLGFFKKEYAENFKFEKQV